MFTEGTWIVGEENYTDALIPIYGGEGNEAVVCEVWAQGDDPYDVFTCEARDNARLISKSKDLFFACKSLFDAPHHDHFSSRMSDGEYEALERIRELVELIQDASVYPSASD